MRVTIPLFEGVEELDVAGVLSVVGKAVALGLAPAWQVETVAEEAIVRGAHGLRLVPHRLEYDFTPSDLVVVPGGAGAEAASRSAALARGLREHASRGRWLASVSTGALVLARCGLLEGRVAQTSRGARGALAPLVKDVPAAPRVVVDGRVATAGGPAAAIDLGLHLIERFLHPEAALAVGDAVEHRGWLPGSALVVR